MVLIISCLWINMLDYFVPYMLVIKHNGSACVDLIYIKGLNGLLMENKCCSLICAMLQRMWIDKNVN